MKMRLLRNSNCTGANSNELIQNHPWDIQSVHELLYFNCPSCVYKDHCKQKLINHAYDHHPECVDYLIKIKDGTLRDVICPWNIKDLISKSTRNELTLRQKISYIEISRKIFNFNFMKLIIINCNFF